MTSDRKRMNLTPGLATFVPPSMAALLGAETSSGPALPRIARSLLEVAGAQRGATVLFDRHGSLSGLLRGARDAGLEPRIVAPAGSPGLGARLAMTVPLQGPRTGEPFQATTAALAEFIANYCRVAGGAPDPALKAKAAASIMKAAERSTAGLDIAQLTAMLSAALPSAHPLRGRALEALQLVGDAEKAAGIFASPVSWGAMVAPSPAGRAAAVVVQLASLSGIQADLVEELALASLSAQQAEVRTVLREGPVALLAHAPRGPLGQWAIARLGARPVEGALAVFALLHARGELSPLHRDSSVSQALVDGETLQLPGLSAPMPLAGGLRLEPLADEEVVAFTPSTLARRIVGAASGDEEEPGPQSPADSNARATPASTRAIREVAGDLAELARKPARAGISPSAKKKGDYEAADFELK